MRQKRNRIDRPSPSRAGDEQRHREREPEGQRRHQDREQGRAREGVPVERLQEELPIVGKTERVHTRSHALAERKDGDLDMRQDDEAAEPQERRRDEEPKPEAARRSHAAEDPGRLGRPPGDHGGRRRRCRRAARSAAGRRGAACRDRRASIRSDEFAPSKSTAEHAAGEAVRQVGQARRIGRERDRLRPNERGRPVAVDRAHALDDAAARQAHRRRAEGRRQHLARPLVGLADEAGDEARRGVMVELARRADLLEAAGVHDRDAVRHHQRLGLVVGDVDEAGVEGRLDLLQLELHLLAQLEIEGAERLVEQHERRLEHETAGDRDALAAGRRRGWRPAGRRSPASRRGRACGRSVRPTSPLPTPRQCRP